METDVGVEKRKTVFPHQLAKRLLAFHTVSTGPAAMNQQTTKPDTSLATKTGHFHLLPTETSDSGGVDGYGSVWDAARVT